MCIYYCDINWRKNLFYFFPHFQYCHFFPTKTASPGCPVTLTHLFLWLTWAPLVARKRAAASFPASAARCSKQFPRRKWAYSFSICITMRAGSITLHHTLPFPTTFHTNKPTPEAGTTHIHTGSLHLDAETRMSLGTAELGLEVGIHSSLGLPLATTKDQR